MYSASAVTLGKVRVMLPDELTATLQAIAEQHGTLNGSACQEPSGSHDDVEMTQAIVALLEALYHDGACVGQFFTELANQFLAYDLRHQEPLAAIC